MRAADTNTRRVAVGGVLLALVIALLYLKTALPVLDLSIYVLLSFLPGIVLIETDSGFAWVFFAASSLLSLVLPVNKLNFLLYYSFFGYYGILKHHVEKIGFKALVITLKVCVAAAAFSLNFFFASAFLPSYMAGKGTFVPLLIIAVVFLFIYDYIYTLAMVFYHDRIKRKRE